MKIDTRTAVLLRRRAERVPVLLFHEVRTPARRRARIERLARWMGPDLWMIAGEYRDDSVLRPGARDCKRWATTREAA